MTHDIEIRPTEDSFTSRRDFLRRSYNGIGGMALANLLADDLAAAPSTVNPLAARQPHLLARKAKHCIFLFMQGGVS